MRICGEDDHKRILTLEKGIELEDWQECPDVWVESKQK